MKTKLFILLFVFLGIQFSKAQKENSSPTQLSVEIDPATFFMNGYGIHLRLKPKHCTHALFGIGVYALDLPKQLIDLNAKNKDKNWNLRIKQGVSLFAEHHFKEVNEKWFTGIQLGLQTFELEKNNVNKKEEYTNVLSMGYVGYTFTPFKSKIYFKPWLGFGYTQKVSGDNKINTESYDIAPLTYFATLHIGYTF